jgi:hypothetical protein
LALTSEVPGLNSGQELGILTADISCGFPQCLQAGAGNFFKVGLHLVHVLPHLSTIFKLILHKLSN